MNPANGFIGINATGKTSVLKVILLVLEMINNEPINHIETRDILGESEKVVLNTYFFSETTGGVMIQNRDKIKRLIRQDVKNGDF